MAFLSSFVALSGYLISRGQQTLIEFHAVQLAEIVTRQSASSRSVYAEHVVGKLTRDGAGVASEHYKDERGNVPLPVQFLKLVGERVSVDSRGLYRYRPVSKWNLAADASYGRLPALGPGASASAPRAPRRRSPGIRGRIDTVEGVSTRAHARRPGGGPCVRELPQRARIAPADACQPRA